MKVAVYGAGGVGGYFGSRLAQAGLDVGFVARGAHLETMLAEGLRIESPLGDAVVKPVRASAEPAGLGVADVVLVAVKTWQVADAARRIAPLLGPGTMVVPLQNGVEAADVLAEAVGRARVVGGLCKIVSRLAAPGWIRHDGVAPRIEVGELDGSTSPRVEAFRAACERAPGMTLAVPADIRVALWEKLLFIAPVSAVGAVTRLPIGPVRACPESRSLLERAAAEVQAVAAARGVTLGADAVARMMRFLDGMAGEATTSLQRDVAEGRPSEVDAQIGAVVRLGREHGVPTPVSDVLQGCLAPLERAARRQG